MWLRLTRMAHAETVVPAVAERPQGAERAGRRTRAAAVIAGYAFGLAALIGIAAHVREPHRAAVLGVSAFAPYLLLGAPLALGIFVGLRRWIRAALALVLC